ncbi:MAG TPA: amino acid ABC transporter permease [Opitutaceae bacterium]|jgi:polar amino acid transport system permease protein|nr:amino acid ABC transporter permease [Opitutaceae bacterium]
MIGPDGQLTSGNAGRLARAPWWLLALALAATVFIWRAMTSEIYSEIFRAILSGLGVTLAVTAVAFPLAIGLGLVTALGLASPHPVRRNVATLYVQVARGVPILVQIFIVAFVLVPLGVEGLRWMGGANSTLENLRASDVPMAARVIAALVCAYGAFEAETVRGGLTSLPKGQAEAARALGLTKGQALRHVLLPQTFRRILPTLGNDLISLLKDSSLVSVLGVRDITQEARLYASATFRYTESLTLLALLYLALTLLLSLGVKALEHRYRRHAA